MNQLGLILLDASIYATWLFMLGIGMTLVFGVQRILNVAHGAAYTFGAYAATTVVAHTAGEVPAVWQIVLIAATALVIGAVLGLALERLVLKPLAGVDPVVSLLGTYAAFLVLEDLAKAIWGSVSVYASAPREALGTVDLFDIPYAVYDLSTIALGLVLGIACWIVLNHSRPGKMVQAVSHDFEMSESFGINTKAVYILTFIVGTVLGTLAGALTAPRVSVTPGIGVEIILVSFAVVVIGGFGSINGAIVASILLGLTKAVVSHYFPAFDQFAVYGVMAVVLIFRPHGIFKLAEARKI